jgi:hypothetical protein
MVDICILYPERDSPKLVFARERESSGVRAPKREDSEPVSSLRPHPRRWVVTSDPLPIDYHTTITPRTPNARRGGEEEVGFLGGGGEHSEAAFPMRSARSETLLC